MKLLTRVSGMMPAALVAAVLLLSSPVLAELRVLFSFDQSGMVVQRVVTVEPVIDGARRPTQTPPVNLEQGVATLTWLNPAGGILAVTYLPDPRVIRSPNHVTDNAGARAALRGGAWVADGPAQASTVIIELPATSALGLFAESWTLSLQARD